jgi:hypothetical protein
MAGDTYYDEDGRYHNHDPNITTFSCSRGHSWGESRQHECQTCAADNVRKRSGYAPKDGAKE